MADQMIRRLKARARTLAPMGLVRRVQKARNQFRHRQQERFDVRHGVDTAGYVWPEEMAVSGESAEVGNLYEATWRGSVRRMIRSLDVDTKPFTFIDIGSGKGAVLMYASEFPFERIIGVEHDPLLHEVAVTNLQAWNPSSIVTSDISSICGDARTYDLPPGPVMLFLCNPFGAEAMESFMARVRTSLSEDPRECLVISFNPGVEVVLDQLAWLQRVNKGWSHATYQAMA